MDERICILDKCCFGCSLRTGSLLIGIFGLICSVSETLYGICVGVIDEELQGWFDAGLGIASFMLCTLLIYGILQEKRSFIMAWVWIQIFMIAIDIGACVLEIVWNQNPISAIIFFIVSGISIYFTLIIRSYALTLEEKNSKKNGGGGGGGAGEEEEGVEVEVGGMIITPTQRGVATKTTPLSPILNEQKVPEKHKSPYYFIY